MDSRVRIQALLHQVAAQNTYMTSVHSVCVYVVLCVLQSMRFTLFVSLFFLFLLFCFLLKSMHQ
jgi:hypothetical protein